jgi:hypothetical protein
MTQTEKIFTDRKIGKDSSPEEFRDAYIEYSKVMTTEEGPMYWIALPNSTLFVASYNFRLVSNYIKQSHSSLLDVGSGRGAQALYWKTKGFDRVEGCDISPHFATGHIRRGIPYKIVDLNCENLVLPYRDNEFDVVTCSHVVEHIKYPSKVVEELVRVSNDLVIVSAPLGKSHWSESHINYWNDPAEIARGLLKEDWVFSIELCISNILKDVGARINEDGIAIPMVKQLSFIAVIYKQYDANNPGFSEWMWGNDEVIKNIRKSRMGTFLYLSTDDNLFVGDDHEIIKNGV